ncbi:hypothetical protein N781_18285 [Pontibacillus halophilus JSM 076056 = DSM 19796]|uniref:Core domain-containing protein n=1 Tax=Pontibacillus halophilus JSM 076056 = DSM 19796 TaxID=1385510 RepID=A0A0A5GLY2_9BACI|nr:iron-sulfur cluster biosynthesis family protein [Pontibacillus halophilus]KGX92243.1 hypothetical protein N781_18285 [Pontibacillus halophilus JSM 076056 = DSM 19796]
MNLEITQEALQQLKLLQPADKPTLRLHYDTDGLGCGVNGQPIVFFTNESTSFDKVVENESYTVVIDEQQKTFFHSAMKLEWTGKLFRLNTPNGLLNPSISGRQVKTGAM